MRPEFVDSLICPETHQSLELSVDGQDAAGNVIEGFLHTGDGRRRYRITNGIPRFVDHQRYSASFGFEWEVFRKVLFNEEHFQTLPKLFAERYALPPDEIRGKYVLDAGCGAGRFTCMCQRWKARRVVGIDLSNAVDFAARNIGAPCSGVEFVQADIFNLPFKREIFDVVFSIGVLHHTPDPAKAFESLVPFLRDGGRITAGLYTNNWGIGDRVCRTFTPHLPKRLLYLLSHLAVPLYTLYRLPHVGRLLYRLLPIFMSPKARERILNTFDWYSPVYQHYTSTDTVVEWFRDAGLTEIETAAQGHASGIKPIRDSREMAGGYSCGSSARAARNALVARA